MRKSGNIIFISFIVFFLYLFVVYDIDFRGPDEPIYFAYTASVVEDGDLNVVNQDYRSRQFAVSETYNSPMFLNHGGVVLWAPFYAYAKLAHFIAARFNLTTMTIYGIEGLAKCALSFSSVTFGLLAMLLTYLFCRLYCSKRISLWSAVVVFFGTPFFYYTLFEGGNANIVACLFSIISIWLCSHWAKMNRWQLFLYGAFFSVCVAVKSELWIQAFFIIVFFMALLFLKKTSWRSAVYFAAGFIPILIARAINSYLTYGTLHMEEVIYVIAALRCRLSYNFNGLFSSFRGLLYTSPIFYICLSGFVLVLINVSRNIKSIVKGNAARDVFLFILTSYAVIKLLFVGRMFSAGGETLSARALVAEFPVFVLLYGYTLQMQKRYLKRLLGAISLLLVFWNLLIISEYMAGLDWLYVTGAPGIMKRIQSFGHMLNLLFYANNPVIKIMLCLPLLLIISWLVLYILQRSGRMDNSWFWYREGQSKGQVSSFLYFFAIYACLAYAAVTSINMINNKKNVEELRKRGFFENARIMDISPIKMTEFEEEEHLRFFFDLKRFYSLKNDIRMLNYIREFKEDIYGKREATHDHYHSLPDPYSSLADSYSEKGRYKKAIDSYRDILQLAPRDIDAFIGLSDIYVTMGNYTKAAETLEEAVRTCPYSVNILVRLANIYKETNDLDKAIEFLKKDIELNPGSAPSHAGLADVYASKGDYDAAIKHYNAAIKINPKSIDACAGLAEIYARKADYTRSIEYYHEALKLSPGSIKFYSGLAGAYIEAGMEEDAELYLKKIIKLNPDSASNHINLADVYASKGDYDAAIKHYNAAIKINPKSIDACAGLAEIYARKADYTRSIEYYKKALELNPGSIKFYTGLANAYIEAGMGENAELYLKKIIELNPDSFSHYINLGDVYASKGDYDRAIENFNKSISINPNNAYAYRVLGEIYIDRGDMESALKQIMRLKKLRKNDLVKELEGYIKELSDESE